MDFFSSQESLTVLQWTLRAIVAFFFLLFLAKIMGQRTIAQLRLLDFMLALIVGNIISHPLSDEKLGLKGSLVTMTVIVGLYITGIFLSMKWSSFRNFLEPAPFPLIKDGKIIYSGLWKARISLDILLSELRKEKVDDIQKVSLALWEPGGTLSVFMDTQHKTLTPADMQVVVKQFSFPLPIIKEGKIDYKVLEQIGKDEAWIRNRISTVFSVNISEILLATVDNKHEVKIFLYE